MKLIARLRIARMPLLFPAILLTAAGATHAVAQDAGSLLQQVQPAIAPRPAARAPDVQVAPDAAVAPAASAPFAVTRIQITGNNLVPTSVLHALVADQEGRTLTLQQLEPLAQRITEYYRQQGFTLSRAIIPAQTIEDGVVLFQVVEARYGAVRLDNRSMVDDRLLQSTLAPLRPGAPITDAQRNQALLLLSDVPGVGVSAVFKPGAAVGAADLDVVTTAGDPVIANVAVDNYGNRYVGRARLTGQIALFNPLHHGDILSVSGVTSGKRLNFGQVSYDILLNGSGTRAGTAVSTLGYTLGDDARSLDAHGSATVVSGWLKQPLVRSSRVNISGQLEYDHKRLRDRVDTGAIRTDRHLDELVISLTGDLRDSVGGGGITAWSAALMRGRTRFDDDLARAADAASARTGGRFLKWNISASRLQSLGARTSLYATIAAQGTDSNLDSAEKLTLGGPYSVRAYDVGALSAVGGYFGTVELRQDLGMLAGQRWRATAFVDAAHVTVNHRQWVAGDNHARLAGAGAALLWEGAHGWHGTASVAARLGHESALVVRQASVRGWVSAGKTF